MSFLCEANEFFNYFFYSSRILRICDFDIVLKQRSDLNKLRDLQTEPNYVKTEIIYELKSTS